MPDQVVAVVLAAGEGKRMKSSLPKVLHKVCGSPMLVYVVEAAKKAGVLDVILVINPEGEVIKELFNEQVRYVFQKERLGTGHAVLQAREAVSPETDTVLVLSGDTPLLSAELLSEVLDLHRVRMAAATVVTTVLPDPSGYGRIVRNESDNIVKIVEETDASPEEKKINEVNAGIYAFDRKQLFSALEIITPTNKQGEYYLTDVLEMFCRQNLVVAAKIADCGTTLGINNRIQLAEAEQILRRDILNQLMLDGVTVIDPSSTFIDAGVEIGRDTIIYPFTVITGATQIGENCTIGPSVHLHSVAVASEAMVSHSVLRECWVGEGTQVGPYSYLRPGTVLEAESKAGTFVEIKKSIVGKKSKVPHLSYIGDTIIEDEVNIGAGTITCNYDGWEKHKTFIEKGAFIGSNTNLVAPVRIGEQAVTGAGSTITKDVPDYALAIERSQQVNISDWKKRKLAKKSQVVDE